MARKNITMLNMIKQLDMMYRIDSLFRSQPERFFTLQQVSGMLGVSTRTVERLYDAMRFFGAPINTTTKNIYGVNGGTNYFKNRDYVFDVGPTAITTFMARKRLKEERSKALANSRKLRRVQSLLIPID